MSFIEYLQWSPRLDTILLGFVHIFDIVYVTILIFSKLNANKKVYTATASLAATHHIVIFLSDLYTEITFNIPTFHDFNALSLLLYIFNLLEIILWSYLIFEQRKPKWEKTFGTIIAVSSCIVFISFLCYSILETTWYPSFLFYIGTHMLCQKGLLTVSILFFGFIFNGKLPTKMKKRIKIIPKENNPLIEKKANISAKDKTAYLSSDTINRLTQLKALLDSGIITEQEFEVKKQQILGVQKEIYK